MRLTLGKGRGSELTRAKLHPACPNLLLSFLIYVFHASCKSHYYRQPLHSLWHGCFRAARRPTTQHWAPALKGHSDLDEILESVVVTSTKQIERTEESDRALPNRARRSSIRNRFFKIPSVLRVDCLSQCSFTVFVSSIQTLYNGSPMERLSLASLSRGPSSQADGILRPGASSFCDLR